MKILVFTEGTILMHPTGINVSRGERVLQVERKSPDVKDYASYVAIGNAQQKLKDWQSQGADIIYLTSRQTADEVNDIQTVTQTGSFTSHIKGCPLTAILFSSADATNLSAWSKSKVSLSGRSFDHFMAFSGATY